MINDFLASFGSQGDFKDSDAIHLLKLYTGKTYKNVKHLGTGTCGTAFLYGRKYVIKITLSGTELEASKKLLNKNTKFFAKVYDVYQRPNDNHIIRGFVIREYIKNSEITESRKIILESLNILKYDKPLFFDMKDKEILEVINLYKEAKSLGFNYADVDSTTTNYGIKNNKLIGFDTF